jgi:hydrogenase-4 component B
VSAGPFVLGGLGLLGLAMVASPRERPWLGLTLAGTAALAAAATFALVNGAVWTWRCPLPIGGEFPRLFLDPVAGIFLVLLAVVGAAGAVYLSSYASEQAYPRRSARGRLLWSGMLAMMTGVFLAGNGLQFLACWELFALAAFFLILLDDRRRGVRRAGWLYLAASHAGTLALFAFFTLLAARTGTWDLGPRPEDPGLAPLFWLALLGFGLKAGLFPLHVWLPSAHGQAPSHVSALLSGVAIKTGLYGLVRFSGWLPLPGSAGWTLLGVGAVGAVVGIAFALAQTDLKRLLAYCSVENMGILVAGLGAAVIARDAGQTWGLVVLAGVFLHTWNHGVFKALLFLAAGAVHHACGTREISRLGGLWTRLPWTTAAFAAGAAAAAALPPLSGFSSEWLIYLGLFDAASQRAGAAWGAVPAVLLLALAGALALATFVKAVGLTFLGAARSRRAEAAHEAPRAMLAPMIALAALCLLGGVGAAFLWPLLRRAAGAWHPAWSAAEVASPLAPLSPALAILALAAVAGAMVLHRRVARTGTRRAVTWDCGYATPGRRMQYTAGSFGAMAAEWFRWILRPERRQRRPRDLLAGPARLLERTPETILERGLEPAARLLLRGVDVFRRLQHGGLQSYLLYVLVGIGALAVLVATSAP